MEGVIVQKTNPETVQNPVYVMPQTSTYQDCLGGTPTVTGAAAAEDMAAISINARLPDFWPHLPRLWFAQFEFAMMPQKASDDVKFQVAVSKLAPDVLQQVSDIIFNNSLPHKYQTLKDRLLQVYEDSINAQFKRLVSELELGAQKPSQLLRQMQDIGRNMQISEQILKNLWLSRLPATVRASLAVTQELKLDKLAGIADNIMEHINVGEIASVYNSAPSTAAASAFPVSEILAQINKLTLEVATLRTEAQNRGRSSFRGRSRGRDFRGRRYYDRSRSRSKSSTRITPNDPKWLCRYHYKFRDQAQRCEKPCNWDTKQGN